jgi:hypothetical protein
LCTRFQRALHRRLTQIVRIGGIVGQTAREATQSRQQRKQFLFKGHSIPLPTWMKRRCVRVSSLLFENYGAACS